MGHVNTIVSMTISAIATHKIALHATAQNKFSQVASESICDIQEKLHLGK